MAGVVVRFAVAIFAFIKAGVVEGSIGPTIAAVAVGALAGIVAGRGLAIVATGAGVVGGVIKGYQLPGFGRVAG